MNRIEKVLSIFMILTLVTFWSSLSAFAVAGSQSEPYFPDLTSSSSPPPAPPSKSAVPSKPASQTPVPSSSKASSSSKPVKKTEKSGASSWAPSSDVSSEPESGDFLGGLSSDLSGSSGISLPSVDSVTENDPLSSVVTHTESSHRMNWVGLLSWACIALGVIVVLIVVFSNRRPPRGMGRKRYRRPKRSRKKKLLNDKYYRHINRY
jgi:hypothetical protein